ETCPVVLLNEQVFPDAGAVDCCEAVVVDDCWQIRPAAASDLEAASAEYVARRHLKIIAVARNRVRSLNWRAGDQHRAQEEGDSADHDQGVEQPCRYSLTE